MIDNLLCDYIFKQYESKLDRTDAQIYLKVKNEIISAKEKLFDCNNNSVLDKINILIDLNKKESFETTISVDEINSLLTIRNMYNILIDVIKDSIINSKIQNTLYLQLEVVLLGGTSKISLFQNKIQSFFNIEMSNNNSLISNNKENNSISIGCYLYGTIVQNKWNYNIEENVIIPHLIESKLTNSTTTTTTTSPAIITPIIKTRKTLKESNETNISLKKFDINPPSLYNDNKINTLLRKSPSTSEKRKINNIIRNNKTNVFLSLFN